MKFTKELQKQIGAYLLGKSRKVPHGAVLRMTFVSLEPAGPFYPPSAKVKLEVADDKDKVIGEVEVSVSEGNSITLAQFKQFFEISMKN